MNNDRYTGIKSTVAVAGKSIIDYQDREVSLGTKIPVGRIVISKFNDLSDLASKIQQIAEDKLGSLIQELPYIHDEPEKCQVEEEKWPPFFQKFYDPEKNIRCCLEYIAKLIEAVEI